MDSKENSNGEPGKIDGSNTESTAANRLRRAVSAAADGAGSLDDLQSAARMLVAELRGRERAPEQMLVELKALLADAGLRSGYPVAGSAHWKSDRAAIYRDIITWSIRCYYEDGTTT